ncbi:TPR repeat protein [Phytophthora cinnamomi]|nr:TPR repeat protein [Phytophthora cinnamomi]
MGDLDAAVKVFEDAADKFPSNANLHFNLANMRMARSGSAGDDAFDSEVAKCLERAVQLSPETYDFVEDLAAYLEQHGQQSERVRELKAKGEELKSAEAAEEKKEDSEEEEKEGGSEDENEEEDDDGDEGEDSEENEEDEDEEE